MSPPFFRYPGLPYCIPPLPLITLLSGRIHCHMTHRRYLESRTRFGMAATPYVYPTYGLGELPQSFAVGGAVAGEGRRSVKGTHLGYLSSAWRSRFCQSLESQRSPRSVKASREKLLAIGPRGRFFRPLLRFLSR